MRSWSRSVLGDEMVMSLILFYFKTRDCILRRYRRSVVTMEWLDAGGGRDITPENNRVDFRVHRRGRDLILLYFLGEFSSWIQDA